MALNVPSWIAEPIRPPHDILAAVPSRPDGQNCHLPAACADAGTMGPFWVGAASCAGISPFLDASTDGMSVVVMAAASGTVPGNAIGRLHHGGRRVPTDDPARHGDLVDVQPVDLARERMVVLMTDALVGDVSGSPGVRAWLAER